MTLPAGHEARASLFEEARRSPGVAGVFSALRARPFPRVPLSEEEARNAIRDLRHAIAAFCDERGFREMGEELASQAVLARHRWADRPRYALTMAEALLPSGESICGDWERVG